MSSLNRGVPHRYTWEGGRASHITPKEELTRAVMSCLLWEDQFYESGDRIEDRIDKLCEKVEINDLTDLAMRAKHQMHLRHVPLLLALKLAKRKALTKEMMCDLITRVDDMMETLSLYWKDRSDEHIKRLPQAVKKGIALAFRKWDEYQLSKYRKEGKQISLKDVLKLTHPKPVVMERPCPICHSEKGYYVVFPAADFGTGVGVLGKEQRVWQTCKKCDGKGTITIDQSVLWKKVIEGTLKQIDTWESLGNSKESWEKLLKENRLSGDAFLKNLRNMREKAVDEELILDYLRTSSFSRILPYRFITAARYAPQWESEIECAMMRVLLASHERLEGKTVLLIDVSWSMNGRLSAKSELTRMDAACALAIIAREMFSQCQVYTFSNHLVEVPNRRGFALRDAIINSQSHDGTALAQALLNVSAMCEYERIIVFTDEQSQDGCSAPLKGSKAYMLNVASNENGVGYGDYLHISGFSEYSLKYIYEMERSALL